MVKKFSGSWKTCLNSSQGSSSNSQPFLLILAQSKTRPETLHIKYPPDPFYYSVELVPSSEFLFRFFLCVGRRLNTKERGGQAADVSFSFHECGEGGDAVPDEVVCLSQDVQVSLGQVRLQAHHLHLQRTQGRAAVKSRRDHSWAGAERLTDYRKTESFQDLSII